VYIYESSEDNLYVHHDIMLPSQPLCVEWINYNTNSNIEDDGTRRGNMAAIGSWDPNIEIWDLDVIESVYPDTILGVGAGKSETTDINSSPSKNKKKKKKKKKTAKGPNDQHHVDSVLCLSSNRLQRNLLLSGSADTTLKLWDLTKGSSSSCAKSYSYHGDKVSAIQWHPTEAFFALSGGYDRVSVAADFRTTEGVVAKWKLAADVEGVKWDPHDPNYFYVWPIPCGLTEERFRWTVVLYSITISGCTQTQKLRLYGRYKLMTMKSLHLTSLLFTLACSSLVPNSSSYGIFHLVNQDPVWSSQEISI
jgi:periodic tryptophan protein 1